MKALPFKIPKTQKESFKIQKDELAHFYNRLHHHPELQIIWIQESYGTRFVGDSIGAFEAGDLLFIGSNVPHWFRNDQVFLEKRSKLRAQSISLFFRKDSFGNDFFQLPEMSAIQAVMDKARRGLSIKGNTKDQIIHWIQKLSNQAFVNRLLCLLQILDLIAQSEELEYLSSIEFDPVETFGEPARSVNQAGGSPNQILNQIFQHVMDHYEEPIYLEPIAKSVNMSVSTFCRYFKLRTQKTFIQFVNEIRIGAACKLIRENEKTISEIAYQVGFNNLSNFNRQFKKITGFTPKGYGRV